MRQSIVYEAPSLPTLDDHRRGVREIVDAKLAEAALKFRHLTADGDRSGARDRLAAAMNKLGEWKSRLAA